MLNKSWTDGPFGAALESNSNTNNNNNNNNEFDADADVESESESLSFSRYAPLFCLQMITSILSIIASIIVTRISFDKLCSSYQRYSLFLGLHLLLVPTGTTETTETYSYWAVENNASCTAAGFFIVFGSLVVSMYHTAITFYFYYSIQPMRNNNNSNCDQKTKKCDDDNRNNTKMKTKTNKRGSEGEASESSSSSISTSELSQEEDTIG